MGYQPLMSRELTELNKPTGIILAPQLVSIAATYLVNAILLNEQVNPSTDPKGINRISVRDLKFIIGQEATRNALYLEMVLDELMLTKIKWSMLDGDFKDVEATTFLQRYGYRSNKEGYLDAERGYVTYQLSDAIREILERRNNHARVMVILQRLFNKPYSARLYETCLAYLHPSGEKQVTFRLDVTAFRDVLGAQDKYPEFKELNKFVIKPAVDEVNRTSNIDVIIKPVRGGRTIAALDITATEKTAFQLSLELGPDTLPSLFVGAIEQRNPDEEARLEALVKKLKRYAMGRERVVDAVKARTLAAVEQAVSLAEDDLAAGYRPVSPAAYVKAAVAGNVKPGEFADHARQSIEAELSEEESKALSACVSLGVTLKTAEVIVRTLPIDQIRRNVHYLRKLKERKKISGGYAQKAISEDYAAAECVEVPGVKDSMSAFLAFKRERVRARLAALPVAELEALRTEFKASKLPSFTREKLAQEGFSHLAVQLPFEAFAMDKLLDPATEGSIAWFEKHRGTL